MTRVTRRFVVGMAMLSLGSLGACSYVSAFAAVQDMMGEAGTEGNRTQEACARARTNMINAADPVEARQWEILMEDLDCPTQREFLERN
ncbi:MAG: hypothetical protein K9H25_10455 [Rhodospirillum sp.]|nr:hypothetical protein [Rhodospirillum sp.]MCF8490262.1 hypothetical protein [Rhodospirillum sp.]MCF8499367.1 hypothetical protein [Rhodospirillum sp.]